MPNPKYDNRNPNSIYEYSKQLLNHSLYDLFGESVVSKARKGKGGLGQMVEELFFGYDINSDSSSDFKEAGVELKCTPLLKYKDSGEWRIKERMVCTMIDYFDVVDRPFEESHFIEKCKLMLLLFYLHLSNENFINYKFIFSVLWKLPEKDLLIIKQDYELIAKKIKEGNAHLLSEGDTVYLAACRKGQKGDKLQPQPFSTELAPKRAFSLKPAYMRTILNLVVNSGTNCLTNFDKISQSIELVSKDSLKTNTFENIITNKFSKFIGLDYLQICQLLNISPTNAKHKYSIISNAIVSNKIKDINNSEEFKKSGITLKTIRVSEKGMPKESMSFKNINYEEIYENSEWIDSELYELFTNRFLFVVFKKVAGESIEFTNTDKKGILHKIKEDRYVLSKVFFWTMPPEDLDIAYEYWQNIRESVLNDAINLKSFWAISDSKNFHVRPKGTKDSYKNAAVNPNGGCTDKYCYWFNAKYIKSIIDSANGDGI